MLCKDGPLHPMSHPGDVRHAGELDTTQQDRQGDVCWIALISASTSDRCDDQGAMCQCCAIAEGTRVKSCRGPDDEQMEHGRVILRVYSEGGTGHDSRQQDQRSARVGHESACQRRGEESWCAWEVELQLALRRVTRYGLGKHRWYEYAWVMCISSINQPCGLILLLQRRVDVTRVGGRSSAGSTS